MDAGAPDYYALLGLPPSADLATVRAAYRELAARWHPDRHPDDPHAGARFKALVEAYAVLGDETRRRAYDEGHLAEALPIERGSGVAEVVGGVVDRLLGVRDARPQRGRNRVYRLTVPFVEAMIGTSQRLSLPRTRSCGACEGRGFAPGVIPEICPRCLGFGELLARPLLRTARVRCARCDGRGYVIPTACEACGGRGELAPREAVTVELPPGLEDGASLRIRGAGERGRGGARDGDLLVEVSVTPHPTLRRQGDDITLTRPLPVFLAIVGGSITVDTIRGPRSIRVPAGTRDKTVLSLTGYGVPRTSGGAGDQRVTLALELPASLDETAVATLRRLMARLPADTFPASNSHGRHEAHDEPT